LELDVLFELLSLRYFFVVEAEARRLAVDGPDDADILGVGELQHAASGGNELQHRGRLNQRIRPGTNHLTGDEDLAAVDRLYQHRHGRFFDVLGGRLGEVQPQLFGGQARGLNLVDERHRDLAVGTD